MLFSTLAFLCAPSSNVLILHLLLVLVSLARFRRSHPAASSVSFDGWTCAIPCAPDYRQANKSHTLPLSAIWAGQASFLWQHALFVSSSLAILPRSFDHLLVCICEAVVEKNGTFEACMLLFAARQKAFLSNSLFEFNVHAHRLSNHRKPIVVKRQSVVSTHAHKSYFSIFNFCFTLARSSPMALNNIQY